MHCLQNQLILILLCQAFKHYRGGCNKGTPPPPRLKLFHPFFLLYVHYLKEKHILHIRVRSFRGFRPLDPHHDFALNQLGASSSPLTPCRLLRPFQKFLDPPLTFNIDEFHILSKIEPGIINSIMYTLGKCQDCFHIS